MNEGFHDETSWATAASLLSPKPKSPMTAKVMSPSALREALLGEGVRDGVGSGVPAAEDSVGVELGLWAAALVVGDTVCPAGDVLLVEVQAVRANAHAARAARERASMGLTVTPACYAGPATRPSGQRRASQCRLCSTWDEPCLARDAALVRWTACPQNQWTPDQWTPQW